MSESKKIPPGEQASDQDALEFLQTKIEAWDFKTHTEQENSSFLLNVAHWSLEVFGSPYGSHNNDYTYALFSRYDYGDGFGYEELPESLQSAVFTESYGEIYVGNNNGVDTFGTYRRVDEPPYIPKWDELSEICVFTKMLEAARADPEIMAMIMPGKSYITPAVELKFEPAHYFGWGLKYDIWPDTVKVTPFGEYGKTETAFTTANAQQQNRHELMQTTLELIQLANQHARRMPRVDPIMFDILEARLDGRAGIPIDNISLPPLPGNSMKSLLLNELMKPSGDY